MLGHVEAPRVLVVLGTTAWRSWLVPFFIDSRFRTEVVESVEGADRICAAAIGFRADAVVFLSHHDSLRRDGCFIDPLASAGVRSVVCQPAALVGLGMDKSAMARAAEAVRGLTPIPELTPSEAASVLADGTVRAVVAKRREGTAGDGLAILGSTPDAGERAGRLVEEGHLLQPFIEGQEYSLNMVWRKGRCNAYPIVGKGATDPLGEHPSSRARTCPASGLEPRDVSGLVTAAVDYLRPLGPSGPVEMEFIRAGDTVYLLEINPRISATLRMSAVVGGSNPFTDLFAAACDLDPLGRTVPSTRHACEWAAPPGLEHARRRELESRGDVWVSTRVTVTAHDPDALARRAAEVRSLLADG